MLAGCATSGPKMADASKATYTEKVTAMNLEELKPTTACPADGKWKGLDWRKVVPMANACVKAKDWRKVEMIGNELAMSAHLTPWGAYFLSLAAQSRKDYPRAIWMLELALKKAPNEGLFHYQMGRVQWELGEEAAAIKSLKLASDLNPSLVDAHYVTGMLALQRDDTSEAEKRLRKALAVDSRHWGTIMAMASLRMKQKDWNQAENSLEDAVRINPRSSRARLALAQVREQHLKKLSEALDGYKEIRTLAGQRKLDEPTGFNLDEKIKMLEQSLVQAKQESRAEARKPSSDKQVKQ